MNKNLTTLNKYLNTTQIDQCSSNWNIIDFNKVQYGPDIEDDSDVLDWISNIVKPNKIFINGEWIKSSSKKNINSI